MGEKAPEVDEPEMTIGRLTEMPPDPVVTQDLVRGLEILRAPFPPDQIEKLPKPTYKGAWDGKKGSKCDVCHGYHVLDSCIHLDYVGHANATNRLLEADPFWSWEPMAFTEAGTPMFSDGGLWIRLTVCGVTRIGYGDGKSVKEVIGDAIRNAAMRFGVGLDLWAKIDLHSERNPGDGKTPQQPQRQSKPERGRSVGADSRSVAPAEAPRAENQDALDTLKSICDEHGYSTQYCIDRFFSDYDQHIKDASVEDILEFGECLVNEATAGPDDSPEPGGDSPAAVDAGIDGLASAGGAIRGAGQEDGQGDGGADGDPDAAVPPAEKMF